MTKAINPSSIGYNRRQLAEMHHAVNPYFRAIMNLEHSSVELNNASFESIVTYCKRVSVFLGKLIEAVEEHVPTSMHAYYAPDEADNLAGDVDDWLEKLEKKQNTKQLIGNVTLRKLKAFIINDMQPRLKELGSQLASLLSLLERENIKALGSQETAMDITAISKELTVSGVKHVVVLAKAQHCVTASEDTLIGLWTGWNIIFPDSTHGPLKTTTGIKGTIPAKVLYNDDTMTYRAFTHTGDVTDWREGFNRTYSGRPEEAEIKLADPNRRS